MLWSMQSFGKNISPLLCRGNVNHLEDASFQLLFDEVSVNFAVFHSIMLNRIFGNG